MAVSQFLFPKPLEQPDSSTIEQTLPAPLGQGNCDSSFQQLLERCAKNQIDTITAINTNLQGVFVCIFNPRFETSIYDEEDQDYHYPVIPDYEGKILITGLVSPRFAGEDQWTHAEPVLWWNQPNIFDIKENAKIVVNHADQRMTFRSKDLQRNMGQHIEIMQIHQLVPFN